MAHFTLQFIFIKAIKLSPNQADYYAQLGIAFCDMCRYADALAPLGEALKRNASNWVWWEHLARAYLHTGNQKESLIAYDKLLDLREDAETRMARNALMEQINTHSDAFPASFYDAVYEQSSTYRLDAKDTNLFPMWKHIISELKRCKAQNVLDIGCGPGQFASFLTQRLGGENINYTGLDFSKVAIEQARKRCSNFRFEISTLPLNDYTPFLPFDTVICTEVLEHVGKDRDLLRSLPAGVNIIASVPNFDDPAHVRHFLDKKEIFVRYGEFFEDFSIDTFSLDGEGVRWLMHGVRSGSDC